MPPASSDWTPEYQAFLDTIVASLREAANNHPSLTITEVIGIQAVALGMTIGLVEGRAHPFLLSATDQNIRNGVVVTSLINMPVAGQG